MHASGIRHLPNPDWIVPALENIFRRDGIAPTGIPVDTFRGITLARRGGMIRLDDKYFRL